MAHNTNQTGAATQKQRLESNGPTWWGKSQVVLGIMDVLVGDVVGGEGAAVVVGRVEGLPRHPTLQSLSCHGPLCLRQSAFCAHNLLFDQLVGSSST